MKKSLLSILALVFAIGSAQAADYNITKYGAVSDTTRLSTKAVQRAIDACSAAGGGRVVVPTGGYKIGSIFLKITKMHHWCFAFMDMAERQRATDRN